MTYRQALHIQIRALDEIYDNAGSLRDCTNYENFGKDAYNGLRDKVGKTIGDLKKHDDRLSDSEAKKEVKGDYSINFGLKDVL
jgi:hypothetical protein